MWPHVAQVKRLSGSGLTALTQYSDHHLPSLHHLSKFDSRHCLILPVLISLSSLDLCFHSSPVIVIVKAILIFDTVAEQSPDSGPDSFATSLFCPVQSSHDDSTTTRPNHITSSSGEEERSHWSSKLQKESDIKMFSSDPKLNPRLPSPTTFDGVKPSYVEWSEEILTFLSVTDYQEFVPVLQAVIGHKDVITKKIFIEGVLSEIIEEIKKLNADLEAVSSGARVVDDQDAEVEKIKGGDQSSRREERFKGSHSAQGRQFPQVCSASLNVR